MGKYQVCGGGEAVNMLRRDNASAALAERGCFILHLRNYICPTAYPLIHLHVPLMRRVIQETYFSRYTAHELCTAHMAGGYGHIRQPQRNQDRHPQGPATLAKRPQGRAGACQAGRWCEPHLN